VPVLQQQRHSLQRAGPVRDDSRAVAERKEHRAHDPQARFLPAAAGDLSPYRALEPGRPEPLGAGEVAVVAASDHRQRGQPGR